MLYLRQKLRLMDIYQKRQLNHINDGIVSQQYAVTKVDQNMRHHKHRNIACHQLYSSMHKKERDLKEKLM